MTDFEEEEPVSATERDDEVGEASHTTRTFLTGLAIGALVGAGVALLFAPQSGAETRRAVSRKAKHLAREARDRYEDVRDKVRRARRERDDAGDASAE